MTLQAIAESIREDVIEAETLIEGVDDIVGPVKARRYAAMIRGILADAQDAIGEVTDVMREELEE